jgi:CelD/BcsL family acetyltransferase involved in cellulose biosynthesis
MLSESINNSSYIKTAQSNVPQLMAAAKAEPVVEAFSGGVEIIERLANEWRELCAEGPCDEPFFRPEWIAAYARAFAPEKKLLIVTARVNGRLCAVLPLVQGWALFHGLPVRMLRGASNVHSCRFDLVHGAGQDGPLAIWAVWQLLKRKRGWDVIELDSVPEGGASERVLRLAQSDGHPTGQWEMSPGPYVTLPGEVTMPDKALRHTSSDFRTKVRRRRRKLEEEGELRLICTTQADPSELERFYQLERSGWKGREGTAIACHAETRKFYDEIARSATQFGYLSLYRLECGNHTVAMQYGLTYGGRYFLIKPAYDENFRQGAPGHIITYEVLRELLAQGGKEFDLLMPQMEWKREWATAARPHTLCYIFARGVVGRALHAYKFRLRPAVRQMSRKWDETPSKIGGQSRNVMPGISGDSLFI